MRQPETPTLRIPIHFYVLLVAAVVLAGGVGTLGGYFAGRSSTPQTQIVEITSASTTEPQQIAATLPADGSRTTQDVIERSLPAVVTIFGLTDGEFPSEGGSPRGPVSAGSGFFFSEDGLLLTNNHVVRDRESLRVILYNGEFRKAVIVGRDPYMDTAVLRVEGGPFRALTLGDSKGLQPGDPVIAIGSPLRNFQGTVTQGIVSGLGRRFPNRVNTADGELRIDLVGMIQIDAALNNGNSGGPLLDKYGAVIGMNTGREQGADGIGFAIPIAHIKQHLSALITNGRTQHGYLGIRFRPVNDDVIVEQDLKVDRGAYIVELVAESTAAAAGIQVGDVVLTINGEEMNQGFSLGEKVFEIPVGAAVVFTVDRDGERLELSAPLQARPEPVGLD